MFILTVGASVVVFLRTAGTVAARYVDRYAVSQNLLERNRIVSIIERDATLSLKLADDPFVRSWMADENDPALREPALEQLESYRSLFRDRSYFVGIAATLSYYVNTPHTDGTAHTVLDADQPHDRWFFTTLASDRDFWINVDFNVLLNEVRVWINTLVRTPAGELLGAAGTGMDLSEFLAALVEHETEGISTIIVNAEGEILAHRNREIIEHNARVRRNEDRIDLNALILSSEQQSLLEEIFRDLPSGPARDHRDDDIRTITLDIEDTRATVSVGYIPHLEWYNLVLVEEGAVMGLAEFTPFIAIILVLLIGVLGAVLVLVNRLVLSPLGRLDEATRSVARGSFEINLSGERRNEFGRLAASFTTMSREIQRYTTDLEKMVEDRTRELRASRERIMESIRYGSLIQKSVMPAGEELEEYLRAGFLLRKPLDQVGGDFAWLHPLEDGFCLALVDCTGHGVPGAFMTMLVSAVLNRVMASVGPETTTEDILHLLHAHVQDGLRAGADVKHLDNGMDIALCRFRRSRRQLEFSGAGLPMIVHDQGVLKWIPAARVRLGFRSTERKPAIPVHRVPVRKDTLFVLFSDGVLDLPGGERGFGLGNSGLERILEQALGNGRSTLDETGRAVEEALERYRGTCTARDDMILWAFMPRLEE
ncbi:MAG: HAMP domain-containing protein [Spirochaetaceae bacterium]|nr:MAG: HAMP domain-containing protein [Spirochaetaceae bacterium]